MFQSSLMETWELTLHGSGGASYSATRVFSPGIDSEIRPLSLWLVSCGGHPCTRTSRDGRTSATHASDSVKNEVNRNRCQ